MSVKTLIEWTDATWNPVRGCSRVSEGCRHCYAETLATRFSRAGQPYAGYSLDGKWTGRVQLLPEMLDVPLRWKRPRRIFVNSMSDLFHESLRDEDIDRVFAIMALAPRHTFQVLTKRAERMRDYLNTPDRRRRIAETISRERADTFKRSDLVDVLWRENPDTTPGQPVWLICDLKTWPLPNVWLGISAETQDELEQRGTYLIDSPAVVHFVSAEPLLGPLDFSHDTEIGPMTWFKSYQLDEGPMGVPSARIDWVIVGGESGHDARPMHPEWARGIRDQCEAYRVPFFFKQWGEWLGIDGYEQDGGVRFDPPLSLGAFGKGCFRRWDGDSCRPAGLGESARSFIQPGYYAARLGKKAAGSRLDGVEHKAFPS